MTLNRHKMDNYVIIASLKSEPMCIQINRLPGLHLLISSLPGSALRTHVESLSKPYNSTIVLKALPGIPHAWWSTQSRLQNSKWVWSGKNNFALLFNLHAGGADFRLSDGSDLKTYLLMRWSRPDALAVRQAHQGLLLGFHLLQYYLLSLSLLYPLFISWFICSGRWCIYKLGVFLQTKYLCVLIHIGIKGEVGDYSTTVKLLTEHNLELLSLTGGCTGLSESTLLKLPHCWKSWLIFYIYSEEKFQSVFMFSNKINNTGYIIVKLYTWVVLS